MGLGFGGLCDTLQGEGCFSHCNFTQADLGLCSQQIRMLSRVAVLLPKRLT